MSCWRLSLLVGATLLVLGTGCATGPVRDDAPKSHAVSPLQGRDSALGRHLTDGLARNPGNSGFRLLDTGEDAFLARVLLADAAEHSIDMQYYIWEGDRSSRRLGERILRAADRGVRVRLLLDDFYLGGRRDFSIASVSSHPNIQIRIFNPLRRRGGALSRNAELVTRVGRLKHRMHNKIFAVDNTVAIVGGRNVGDVYFGVSPDHNYRDLGLLAAGPIVAELSTSFDSFWNSDWAIPIESLHRSLPSADEAEEIFNAIRLEARDDLNFPIHLAGGAEESQRALVRLLSELTWARAELVVDAPDKAGGEVSESVNRALLETLEATEKEALFATPYLMPISKELKGLRGLLDRGVAVRILTNSLASTDVLISHASYASYRPRMLSLGVSIFELRPDASRRSHYAPSAEAEARLSLHVKAAVLDRRSVYIGSFNFDRYGAKINTESGLIVHSPKLAEAVLELLEPDLLPQNSWRVVVGDDRDAGSSALKWIGESNGHLDVYTSEPMAGLGRRIKVWLLGLLPIR